MTNADKRHTLKLFGLSPLALPVQAAELPLTRIAFGSCLHQDKPQPIWDAVLATNPQLFVFLGDNIYGDSDDPSVLAAQYAKLAAQPGFQRLLASTPVIATWDDHDYGRNDAGLEYPAKEASRDLFMDFWGVPAASPRRTRADGIYEVLRIGSPGQDVQILLLDLRWNRTGLSVVPDEAAWAARDAANMGPYNLIEDPNSHLLGEAQWRWLEQQFREPAAVRIIATSIQALADFTGWETWANFPAERERLLALLDAATDSVNLLISGDVHWCDYSLLQRPGVPLPHAELSSSGLTETWDKISPNRHRVGNAYAVPNFGLIDIDWSGARPQLQLSVRDEQASVLLEHRYPV